MNVVVLNANYQFLNFITWKRALTLIENGKAEVLKESDRIVKNVGGSFIFPIPYIIRLVKLIRKIYKKGVPWSKRNVFARDRNVCQYCGKQVKKPEIEHIIPKSKGGKNSWENTVTACRSCNSQKGDRTPSEAGMFLIKQPVHPTINEFILGKLKNSSSDIKKILDDFLNDY